MDRRAFWVFDVEMKDCPDGKSRLARTEDPLDEDVRDDRFVHVVELKPGEIVLSKEQLRAAWQSMQANGAPGHEADFAVLQRALFGEGKP